MGGSFLTGDGPGDQHIFLGKKDAEFPEWEPILWGLGHRGVVPDSDPLDKCFYPSLMHRNVSFNNRLGWIRYSPAGFGKDANGFQPQGHTHGFGLQMETEIRQPHSTY